MLVRSSETADSEIRRRDSVVLLEHQLDCSRKHSSKKFLGEFGWRKYQIGNACSFMGNKDYSERNTWMISKWLEKTECGFQVEEIDEDCWSWRTDIISWPCVFGMYSTWMQTDEAIIDEYKKCSNHEISAGATEKFPGWKKPHAKTVAWSYDMAGPAKKCVERCCELANKKTWQLYEVSTLCVDDHHFMKEELESVGELSKVCSQIVLKCLYLARIGGPDILWSVNKLARSITKWTKACDKRLNRFISYIHRTCEYRQCCHVGNTAKQCRLGLLQDSDFAGNLEDWTSTSGGTLCVFGSHTFVPISWMCKKQTSVSHSSTESEIISLDAGLRLDGIPALDSSDLIVSVLGNTTQNHDRTVRPVVSTSEIWSPPHTIHKRKQSRRVINDLDNVDFIPSNVQSSHQEALLCVWRQRSSDQDDHKGKTPDNETCFQNPQSCSWLVVR